MFARQCHLYQRVIAQTLAPAATVRADTSLLLSQSTEPAFYLEIADAVFLYFIDVYRSNRGYIWVIESSIYRPEIYKHIYMLRRLDIVTAGLALIRYHRTSSDAVDNDANMKSEQPWWFVIEIDASYL